MSIKDLIKMSIGNLFRRKGRTFLSVLGVVVGCCSIVCMMSIGVGMTASQKQWISEMGDLSAISVYPFDMANPTFKPETIAQIEQIENVKTVAAQRVIPESLMTKVSAGHNDRYFAQWANIVGYTEESAKEIGYELIEGELPTAKGTCTMGQFFEYAMFDSKRPDGKNYIEYYVYVYDENGNLMEDELPDPFIRLSGNEITISFLDDNGKAVYSEKFRVVGKFKEDYNIGSETSSGILLRLQDMKEMVLNAQKALNVKKDELGYGEIKVYATDISLVSEVENKIRELGFATSSMESIRESTEKEMATIQLALGGIGAVSLFVAAIGIMNTMIMSVSERTKEIGIMKALGCYVNDVRKLFLLEAASIGFMGGAIGTVISFALSVVANIVAAFAGVAGEPPENMIEFLLTSPNRISVIPLWLFLFGLIFSMLVGLVSGAYPAMKAVKISPLEAMRNE